MSIDAFAQINSSCLTATARPPHFLPLIPMGNQPTRPTIAPDQAIIRTSSTDNPWKLDIHTGKIQLSALFTSKQGEITQCDASGFKMNVDGQSIAVMADPASGAGHVIATLQGKTQPGVITQSGNTSTLRLNDGSKVSITANSGGDFSVSGIAPLTVDVRYPDAVKSSGHSTKDIKQPWYMGKDPSTMSFGQKVTTIFKSLFTAD